MKQKKFGDYDIFGVVLSDRTKIKKLGNKSHREAVREKFRILSFNKNTDIFEFKANISKQVNMLNESFNKIRTPIDLNVYILSEDELNINQYYTCEIDESKVLEGSNNSKYNLYKIKVTEDMPLVFFTNIIYYDNKNGTLPLGMDVSTKALIDCSKFDFTLINSGEFKTNSYSEQSDLDSNLRIKDVNFYEYEITLKQKLDEKSEEVEEKKSEKE